MMKERYQLVCERISEIKNENLVLEPFHSYFVFVASFLEEMAQKYSELQNRDWDKISLNSLAFQNKALYEDVLADHYDKSYANPTYAREELGETFGNILSFLYVEMRAIIPSLFEQQLDSVTIRMELFVEVYTAFVDAFTELQEEPKYDTIQKIIYWFMNDYFETEFEERLKQQLDPTNQFAISIIVNNDLTDIRYLYQFGEYITENEIKTALFLNSLDDEEIAKMADTFTEGFRLGFVNTKKDLSIKKNVSIRYTLGFERVVKKAIQNFERMGLQSTIYRSGVSAFHRKGTLKIGYYGGIANKQYEYDHKEDEALYFDNRLMQRKLEVLKNAYEQQKELAAVFAGPACMEVFGEIPFSPANKAQACHLSEEQQGLLVEYASKSGQIVNEYIKGEERSFTIIAFPTPDIGDKFEEIFEKVIEINTLDYKLYETMQQVIIDTLDQGSFVRIKGMNGNKTDLTVALCDIADGTTQTKFENCVADVNIPVGEVFTSPKLTGTNGVLHVTRVFLQELEYKDLELHFEDGFIKEYSCANFASKEENEKYIRDNLLYHHETLPMGEFAIGTNTTAYVFAKEYDVADRLPILIAEKMGPHFAVGDTCYSHAEDVKVYNPNGKEIIARDNEVSMKRKEDMSAAYFNCHTDITIPYDELGLLEVVTQSGETISILREGRFVLDGVDQLNAPFS